MSRQSYSLRWDGEIRGGAGEHTYTVYVWEPIPYFTPSMALDPRFLAFFGGRVTAPWQEPRFTESNFLGPKLRPFRVTMLVKDPSLYSWAFVYTCTCGVPHGLFCQALSHVFLRGWIENLQKWLRRTLALSPEKHPLFVRRCYPPYNSDHCVDCEWAPAFRVLDRLLNGPFRRYVRAVLPTEGDNDRVTKLYISRLAKDYTPVKCFLSMKDLDKGKHPAFPFPLKVKLVSFLPV